MAAARRRGWIVVLCTVLAVGSALAISATQEKRYTAAAALLFRDPGFDQKLFGATYATPPTDANRDAATNVRLVGLGAVASRAAKAYGRGIQPGYISANIAIRAEGQSNLVTVAMTDANPARAAALADEFAKQYIAFRRDADRGKIEEAQRLIQSRLRATPDGEEAATLRERADQLKVLAALQTGNAELVQSAEVPSVPSFPHPRRNAIFGGVLGLLLGLGIALLLERLDRRLRDPEEIKEAFDRPVLGAVPESSTFARSTGPAIPHDLPMPEAEAFRMMRANLRYFNVDRNVRSLYVTSSTPGEGKSTVSWNLAAAAAGAGSRVLLVEADLRRPTFGLVDGVDVRTPGLSQILAGEIASSAAIQRVRIHPALSGHDAQSVMDVVASGPIPPNPGDLIESVRMREFLEEMEHVYDLVVLDTPPASVVSDAIPLIQQVSGVVVVSRVDTSTRDSVARLRSQLQNLNAFTFGIVINGVAHDGHGYGYGYGYEYVGSGSATEARSESLPNGGRNGGPAGAGSETDEGAVLKS